MFALLFFSLVFVRFRLHFFLFPSFCFLASFVHFTLLSFFCFFFVLSFLPIYFLVKVKVFWYPLWLIKREAYICLILAPRNVVIVLGGTIQLLMDDFSLFFGFFYSRFVRVYYGVHTLRLFLPSEAWVCARTTEMSNSLICDTHPVIDNAAVDR